MMNKEKLKILLDEITENLKNMTDEEFEYALNEAKHFPVYELLMHTLEERE